MGLTWSDEVHQDLPLESLRRLCPCAVCEGNRMTEAADCLHVIQPDVLQATASVSDVTSVGRYAIQIRWADGHDTGIYTYSYLRSLGSESTAR